MKQTTAPTILPLNAQAADASNVTSILHGLDAILSDYEQLLSQLPLEAYCAARVGQSSIGAHVRHVLEFMQVLANHCDGGVIDYESRERNSIYETDPKAVAYVLPQLQETLARALVKYGAHHPLLLRETAVVGGDKLTITTSLGREVLFMLQHGTHHLAIITLQAAAMHITLDGQCGVAVATQTYRQKAHG